MGNQNYQHFTSANTSINGKKLPTLYKKVDFASLATCGRISVFDYGCGKFDNGKKFINEEFGGIWLGFDPYNRTAEEDFASLDEMRENGVDCVLCANVLNVIDGNETIWDAVNSFTNFKSAVHPSKHAPYFVTVYEGNRSGEGRQTGKDQFQRNEKTADYLRFFPADAVIKHGVITNHPEFVK